MSKSTPRIAIAVVAISVFGFLGYSTIIPAIYTGPPVS